MPSHLAKDHDGILFLSGKQLPVPAAKTSFYLFIIVSGNIRLRVRDAYQLQSRPLKRTPPPGRRVIAVPADSSKKSRS